LSGIYIHIPFCKQACSYCDFYFVTRQKLLNPFVDSLVKEIRFFEGSKFVQEPVQTIYIGGGTPSLLNEEQLGRIFSAVHDVFHLDLKEVTMELNPDDVTPAYLKMIQRFGVDRASMGVQSFQEEILTFMHRAHNQTEALQALEALQATGFPSFTADLIYGNPGQTLAMLEQDIAQLLKFDPPHISAYSLTVEPKTRLGKQVELGRIEPPDDEIVSEHSDILYNLLEGAGIHQYEVSNYAKPGKEAVHNSSYWNHENYLGFGPAAHSFWREENSAIRWKNRPDIKHYLEHDPPEYTVEEENLDGQTLAEERLMLGLRTVEGVSLREMKQKYGFEFSDRQLAFITGQSQSGTMEVSEHQLKMTREGLKISDLLLVDLLSRG
jgi:oxygen-independent coproporphyrinogen III oxidase